MTSFTMTSVSLGAFRLPVRKPTGLRRQTAVRASNDAIINKDIKKDEAKVVTMLKCGEIEGKAVMCRCWKSKTFPYCDAAHVAHNKATGDNVGPLIISKD
mmetsp:Transcript_35135/g.59145  ORF Transcript_35135/g.59145 Transcript_35135/m.59145 type:complete len:100 (-) Transcript_35135:214-513(-)|eukprot:CAMPEP_0198197090 /NCGR_PEP_ID=MMETSP1445-20131203/668_1 /TAXON_ID=36898 /ORGANISM="Pyramimonas sp., Strain CCMP2087" /LENGTH=99 /DNA_ID=CAMNT_0043866247 /DNA_START=119 /DNA_END=418 /DNA_ORIENTATION=+